MSVSVTGKLNRAANIFQAGDSTGFGVRLGVKFYNRETKAQDYTNYEAVIFARAGNQTEFYTLMLDAGAIIEISGSGCQIKTFQGKNGPINSIAILDAKLGYIGSGATPPIAPSQPEGTPDISFDDELPF